MKTVSCQGHYDPNFIVAYVGSLRWETFSFHKIRNVRHAQALALLFNDAVVEIISYYNNLIDREYSPFSDLILIMQVYFTLVPVGDLILIQHTSMITYPMFLISGSSEGPCSRFCGVLISTCLRKSEVYRALMSTGHLEIPKYLAYLHYLQICINLMYMFSLVFAFFCEALIANLGFSTRRWSRYLWDYRNDSFSIFVS